MADPAVTHSFFFWLQNCHQLHCLQVCNEFASSFFMGDPLVTHSIPCRLPSPFFTGFWKVNNIVLTGWPTGDPLTALLTTWHQLHYLQVFDRLTTQFAWVTQWWPTHLLWWSSITQYVNNCFFCMGDPVVTHPFLCWLHIVTNCICSGLQWIYNLILHRWLTGDSLNSILKFKFSNGFNW
jgi:hypothetical protein